MTDAEIIQWATEKILLGSSKQWYYYKSGNKWVSKSVDQPDANELGKLRLFLCTHGVESFKELLKRLAAGQKLDERTPRGFQVEEPICPFGERYQNKYYAVYQFLKNYLANLPDDEHDAKRALGWLVKLLAVKENLN